MEILIDTSLQFCFILSLLLPKTKRGGGGINDKISRNI
jgi:hypothetical protein